MTMELDETEARIGKLRQRANKVCSDIDNFDVENKPPEELDKLFKEVELIKTEVDEELNMLEVEDFLLNGSGYNKNKNKNI